MKNPYTIGALAMVFALSGVTSAAEKALPGDTLYPIKVYINEGIYTTFTFGNKAEAAWHTERAERRFEEIEQLIAQGKLDEEKAIIIAAYLDHALQEAEVTSDPVEFSAILDAHAAILEKLDNDQILDTSTVNSSIKKAREAATKKKYQNATTGNNSAQDIAYGPNRTTVTEKQTLAKNRFDHTSQIVSDLDLDQATRDFVNAKIVASHDAYTHGSIALDASDYVTARNQFIMSISLMQEAKLIATVPAFRGFADIAQDNDANAASSTPGKKQTIVIDRTRDGGSEDEKEKGKNDEKEEKKEEDNESVEDNVTKTKKKIEETQNEIKESINELLP